MQSAVLNSLASYFCLPLGVGSPPSLLKYSAGKTCRQEEIIGFDGRCRRCGAKHITGAREIKRIVVGMGVNHLELEINGGILCGNILNRQETHKSLEGGERYFGLRSIQLLMLIDSIAR
jgi:hypothetical protein